MYILTFAKYSLVAEKKLGQWIYPFFAGKCFEILASLFIYRNLIYPFYTVIAAEIS